MRTRFACAALAVAFAVGLGTVHAGTAYREFGDRGRAQDVRRTIDVVMREAGKSSLPRARRVVLVGNRATRRVGRWVYTPRGAV